MNTPTPPDAPSAALSVDELDELDSLLEKLRESGHDDIPAWEFFDGFLTALACMRRPVYVAEYLPLMLGGQWTQPAVSGMPLPLLDVFSEAADQDRFLALFVRRFLEVERQLDADVQTLDDDDAFMPATMDLRGALAMLPEEEQASAVSKGPLAYFAQVWALGFMYAVACWPEEWEPPRDKDAARWLDDALQSIDALTGDDTGAPAVSMVSDDAPPSVSRERIEAYGEAIWAVYDLRQLWKSLGPRKEPLLKPAEPGRNDPCWCGSGKKFKKCHGA